MTTYKLVLVGDAMSGKTALIMQSAYGKFFKEYNPTAEDYFDKKFNDDTCFNIKDSAGNEEFRGLLPQHCLTRDAIILCIDLSDTYFAKKSKGQSDQEYIKAYLQRWLAEIKKNAPNTPIQIIGTKTDAIDNQFFDPRISAFRQACNEIMMDNGQVHACHITSAKEPKNEKFNRQLGRTSNEDQALTSPLSGVFEQVIIEDPFEKFKALSISKGNLEAILKTYQDKRNWHFSFFSLCTYGSESIKQLNKLCENLAEDGKVTGADILARLSQHRVESLKIFASDTFPAPKSGTEKIIRELYTEMTNQAAANVNTIIDRV